MNLSWNITWEQYGKAVSICGLDPQKARELASRLEQMCVDFNLSSLQCPPLTRWYGVVRDYSIEVWAVMPDLTDSGVRRVVWFRDPSEMIEWVMDLLQGYES